MLWGASALASLQLAAPEHLRGQAASLYFFAFLGGAPLGGLLAGWLTARGGTQLAFAVAGTVAVARRRRRGRGHARGPSGLARHVQVHRSKRGRPE